MLCILSICTALYVVDGDTIHGPDKVRIWGLDAAEMRDPGGPAARRGMQALTSGQRVECVGKYRDRYGRLVAQCFLPDGSDLACEMIRHGHAVEYRRYSGGFYRDC